jgi:hypothetical protein
MGSGQLGLYAWQPKQGPVLSMQQVSFTAKLQLTHMCWEACLMSLQEMYSSSAARKPVSSTAAKPVECSTAELRSPKICSRTDTLAAAGCGQQQGLFCQA